MESQLQQTHHTHGHHYDDQDILTTGHNTGHDYNEDEHHGEKKSVIKKVKEKAKKLKNTITKHGHGHGGHDDEHHHHDDEDDDDEEETVEDPEVHGAPMYDSARVGGLGGPNAILAQPRGNLERPSVMAEDRYTTRPDVLHRAPPPVSSGAYGTKLSGPSVLGHTQAHGQGVNSETWRGKIGQSTGMEEDPFAPNPTRMVSPTNVTDPTHGTTRASNPVGNRGYGQDVNLGGLKGSIGKSTGMVEDPHAPKDPSRVGSDPSNYESKVTDTTHTGGKAADLSQIQHSFDKMGINDEHKSGSHGQFGTGPKTYDPNHPENLPHDSLTGNQSSRSSSYMQKISSSASAIADKATDVITSKLGYSGQNPGTGTESHEPVKSSGSATDYAHKITDKVTGTLAPVYEKVVDAGSSVMAKVQGTVSGTSSSTGAGTGQQQVHRGSETATVERGTGQPRMHRGSETTTIEKGNGGDKEVSVKEYLVESLRPGDEDKALSDAITHAFHRGTHGESEKKSGEDRPPIERVTESVEVRERLGTDHRQEHSSNVSADKSVTERLSNALGSWFGGKGDAPHGRTGTSYVTDEGLSTTPSGDGNK